MIQLLTLYTYPELHIAQRYRQTNRWTDRQHYDANSWSYCDWLKIDEDKKTQLSIRERWLLITDFSELVITDTDNFSRLIRTSPTQEKSPTPEKPTNYFPDQVWHRYWTHMSPVYLRELLSDCSSQVWCKHWSACLPIRPRNVPHTAIIISFMSNVY